MKYQNSGFIQSKLYLRAIALLACWLCFQATMLAKTKPNVIVILSDDQGWGDLSVHGNKNLSTPMIDSLAKSGATFDRFYACPVCSPTRAEFLTGRYHTRGGVFSTSTGGERLNLDEKTLAEMFKAAGYATGAFGKWHNGMQYPYHPLARGFQEYYGFCSGHWGNYFNASLEHNGKLVRGKGFIIDDFTNHAIKFIEDNQKKPFFCYLPLNTPHSPMQVPDKFFKKFAKKKLTMLGRESKRENINKTRAALAMCENIDWNVGRILKKLDELKLSENTIVIYFSDNGPNGWRWNDAMRGKKGSTDEGGVRVPFFIRWPNKIPAGKKINEIAGAIDLLPTLAELTNVKHVSDNKLDGLSLKPLLMEKGVKWPSRLIFSHWGGGVSVRSDRYRLDHFGRLYDMKADPSQKKNIASEQKEVTQKLQTAVKHWKKEMLPGLRKKERPFTVGYAEFPVTHLPARDGRAHGDVRRSARAPNCSFFRNWTSTKDRITWDIEVATTGKYEATIYYACKKKDVGSTVQLSFNDASLKFKITEPHNPPLQGEKDDRVSRGNLESYVKDFKPLKVGELKINKGRGKLTLQALKIAGEQVMEVRYVVLTLKK